MASSDGSGERRLTDDAEIDRYPDGWELFVLENPAGTPASYVD